MRSHVGSVVACLSADVRRLVGCNLDERLMEAEERRSRMSTINRIGS